MPIKVLLNMLHRPDSSFGDRIADSLIKAAPSGWYYQNLLVYHRNMEASCAGLDIPGKRYDPTAGEKAEKRLETLRNETGPFRVLSRIATPNFAKARTVCARSQAFANEAAVVLRAGTFPPRRGPLPGRAV